jgi:4-diphosphocytidyl-2-C-methyl-D-erythritol kinase
VNDFEASVLLLFPSIAQIKTKLPEPGVVYTAMSGSGSSVYGLFSSELQLTKEDFGPDYFIWKECVSFIP